MPLKTFLPEWHPQEAVMLAWPHPETDWAPWLAEIETSYVALTTAISRAATPLVICRSEAHRHHIEQQLPGDVSGRCRWAILPYDDTWCRDYGPLSVGGQTPEQLLNFRFSGWGDKYAAEADNAVNQRLAEAGVFAPPLSDVEIELEGGSVESDGQGTLMTTETCLLGGNRNEHLSRIALENILQSAFGVDRILWIREGFLMGDDTDSHIDNLVRFASPDTLVHATCDRPEDVHYAPLNALTNEVHALRTREGKPYRCIALPIPEIRTDESGRRLPASYVNFLIVNQYVIVPVFDSPYDRIAMQGLAEAFPSHTLLPVPGGALIKQYGGPHCATMQLPQGTLTHGGRP